MSILKRILLAFAFLPALLVFAQEAQQKDVLIPRQNPALTWIVGVGILVITLIAGFKHPGRTHLD